MITGLDDSGRSSLLRLLIDEDLIAPIDEREFDRGPLVIPEDCESYRW
jgi:hypothetical protein